MSKTLLERLDRTAAELRSVAAGTAVRLTLATAIGGALLLVLIDWLGRFNDPGLRWLFTATVLISTVTAAVRAWKKLEPRDANRLGVAQRLQKIEPQLGSKLASAVEFAESDANDRSAGSAELRRAVVLDAATGADDLPFEAVVDRMPLRKATRYTLAAIVGMVLLGLTNASALGTGLYRLAAPWAEAPWPRRVVLRVIEPPTTLARGGLFEATAVNERGEIPADTQIEYRFASDKIRLSRTEALPTKLVGDQAIAVKDRVERPFSYRFVGGDDDTMEWIDLEVLDPPIAERFSIQIAPPPYSGLPQGESSGTLRVLAGTSLSLAGKADKPLASAVVALPDEEKISLDLGVEMTSFANEAAEWTAKPSQSSASYEVRLSGESGVTGILGPHRYEVLADKPPKVEWLSASDDIAVTTRTLLAIEGTVSDDLAIHRIEAQWSEPATDESVPTEPQRVMISDRGTEPPRRDSLNGTDDTSVDFDWDLEPFDFAEGTELLVWLAATDYLPQEGRTTEPRRLLVVSDEDYRARLAEAQSRLLGQVQQALATQREANDATHGLDADAREATTIDRKTLDRLTSIEFQQREAANAVAEPTSGAAAAAERLLDDLQRSRLDAPELKSQLAAAGEALKQLTEKELPAARGDLADARRAGQRAAKDQDAEQSKQEFSERLGEAETEQRAAIERLEQVADLLTSWADYQRFASEAAALESQQRELAAESQRQAAATASKLMPDPTQAEREKLLTRQAEATRRFDKLRAAMKKLLDSQSNEQQEANTAAEAVGDALAEANDADVAGRLRDASRSLARSQPGAASQSQQAAAEGLKAMLEALRQRTTTDPNELAERLKQEKQKLAELQEQVEALKRRPETRQTAAARKQAGEKAARMSRRLERLTASQAAASAAQGGQQASGQQQDQQPPNQQQELAQAQESFEQAQKEIDQRIEELEDQKTQRLLDQLAARIGGYIERQSAMLDETLGLATVTNAGSLRRTAAKLASGERDLADELSGFAEELSKRAVFELALSGAAEKAEAAADRLDDSRIDRRTQRLESAALARLRQIEEVLRQEQQDQQEREQGGGGGGGGGEGEPPPPSPIEVAELKMLRLMQLEVLGQTDAYEADTATARRSKKPLPPEWEKAGKALAAEQRRLAELALELSERDNDPEADPDEK